MTSRIGRVLLAVLCLLAAQPVAAQSLLSRNYYEAARHGFIQQFQFKEKKTVTSTDGMLEHLYFSEPTKSLLALGIGANGYVVHLRLGVPRTILDQPNSTILGRDLVKGFLETCGTNEEDENALKPLVAEITVRGLDLQPVEVTTRRFEDTGKSLPLGTKAYKLGKGAAQKGEMLIFLDKIPALPANPSEAFLTVMGKKDHTTRVLENCRIGFGSQRATAEQPALLMCDVWDEDYWQSHMESKSGAKGTPAGTAPNRAGAALSKPAAGTSEPAAGLSKPAGGLSKPAAGTSKPVAGLSKPVAGTSKPAAGLSNVAGTSKPVAGLSKPAAGTSKPVAGTSKPVAGLSKPVAGTSKPVARSNDADLKK